MVNVRLSAHELSLISDAIGCHIHELGLLIPTQPHDVATNMKLTAHELAELDLKLGDLTHE